MSKPHHEAPPSVEPLLTIDALASYLACDRRTIERMRSAGKLPRPDLIIGVRSARWKPETIKRWIGEGGKA